MSRRRSPDDRWTRRRLLQAGLAAAAVPAVGLGAGCGQEGPEASGSAAATLAAEIRAALGGTPVEDGALDAFAEDYLRFEGEGLLTPLDEGDPARRFLLSSDLFDEAREPGAPAAYLAFYDPYLTPCSNRLARLGRQGS